MKKGLIIMLLIGLVLVGCSNEEEIKGEFDIKGNVVEIDAKENSILVEDKDKGLIWVALPKNGNIGNYQEGQEVVVWVDGGIDTTPPASAKALNIEITSPSDNQINFGLIESEKTLPTDFHEIAFKRDTTPLFYYLVKTVVNQTEFEETWNLYGFENKTPNVNFNKKDVIFIGVQESGSCPYKIENIEVSSDNKAIIVPLSQPDGACTDDATPRTFVIKVDKEVSVGLKNLIIIQSGVETVIPIDGTAI